jgi:hypothetical protein
MAKKIVLIVVGAMLLLCGLGALVPGALLTRLTSHGGAIDTGYHTIGSPTPALVSPTEKVSSADLPTSGLGATTLIVSARDSDQPVFLGVARAADVDAYLDGVAYDEVRDLRLRPYRLETTRHRGVAFAEPPGTQSFWLATATGTSPTLDWKVQSGDYRVVLMNADGSPGAAANTQVGIKVNGLRGLGVGVLLGGAVAALAGVGLLLWGIKTPARPAAQPPPQPPAQPPPQPA